MTHQKLEQNPSSQKNFEQDSNICGMDTVTVR